MENLELKLDANTAKTLKAIAELKGISVNAAAFLVLEQYADRAKKQIESAIRAADRAMK